MATEVLMVLVFRVKEDGEDTPVGMRRGRETANQSAAF